MKYKDTILRVGDLDESLDFYGWEGGLDVLHLHRCRD